MRLIHFYVFRQFFWMFAIAVVFFAMILELVDLFANITRYLQLDSPLGSILQIQLLYLPRCLSYSFPISTVFAVAFCLGNLYSNNELIAVFSSGISLFRFVFSILLFSAVLSLGSFFFQEYVVIDTLKAKDDLSHKLLGYSDQSSNPNVVLFDGGGRIVYKASLYNDADLSLNDVTIIERDFDGSIKKVLRAANAKWEQKPGRWHLYRVNEYDFLAGDSSFQATNLNDLVDPLLVLEPRTFRRATLNIDQLKVGDAGRWAQSLKASGLPYQEALLNYYSRFSFACTPLIVAFVSAAIGSRLRKNILLLSLLFSLMLAVVYYVIQLISGVLADLQIVSPFIGAWLGVSAFIIFGFLLFRRARS